MKHILLIEDDIALRTAIAELLSDEFRVTTSGNGQTGLQLAFEQRPDLVISDVGLPALNGFELLEELRQHEQTADTPVILMTAMNEKQFIRQGMALGAEDYIPKPFEFEDLLVSIRTQLDKSQKRHQFMEEKINELRNHVSMALPHELRTAIMIIEGYTHLALDDSAHLEEGQHQILMQIRESAERLRSLAEKFLWHTRVQWPLNSKMRLEKVTDAHLMIKHVTGQIAASYNRSADLQLDLVAGDVLIPEEYFQRLLIELLENAFKFSSEGTPVIVQSHVTADSYTLAVLDNGRGLDAQQQKEINAFVQFDRHQYEQRGTGLGLMIVKRLVSVVDGQFHLESIPGRGTLISITIPCSYGHPASVLTDELPMISTP